jgi:hypothetical protein
MNLARRSIAAALALVLIGQLPLLAVGGKKAEYIGGTISGLAEKTEGTLDTSTEAVLRFLPDKRSVTELSIPYAQITSIEYGQKAGRRVAVALLVSPLALFSKKRKHFLTVSYNDAGGKEQAAVLELGKDIIRTTLTIVQTRSGKEIEYQDDEARKAGRGGN